MPPGPNRLVAIVRRTPALRRLIYRAGRQRGRVIVRWMRPCLEPGQRIVDVGAGTGNVTELLRQRGWQVTPLDVDDLTFVDGMAPVLYDGDRMPFAPDTFDVALLSTVLHHTPDPGSVLREAARVASRVIVIEDIYHGRASKYATYAVDSLLTLEFIGHPRSNRTDAGWRRLFGEIGLEVRCAEYRRSALVLTNVLYCLERADAGAGTAGTAA